jgi:DNA-binding response OmpR family regulator
MSDAKKKILLAEDDKFISKAYSAGLQKAGFDIVNATDGVEAIELIKTRHPDIILLDLIMPRKNGFEVLEDLKLDKSIKTVPIVILSNLGQESDVEKAKALGAADYLVKSNYTMDAVVEKVKFHLAKS